MVTFWYIDTLGVNIIGVDILILIQLMWPAWQFLCNIEYYVYITAVFSVDSLNQQQVHQQMLSGCAHFLLEVGVVGDEYDV